jgi:hypothetical protein
MRFKRYIRGAVVAYPFDDDTVGLRQHDGLGLLRTSGGIPRSVIKHTDVGDVATILACIAEDLDRDACRGRGVEVEA